MRTKWIGLLLAGSLIFMFPNTTANADNTELTIEKLLENNIPSYTGIAIGNSFSASDISKQYKFGFRQGHGFAAERANNLIDRSLGERAYVIGDNNALNGADRKIINRNGSVTWIQTKYCATAGQSFNACFRDGQFRYYNPRTGRPYQIEVPSDQYDDVVKLMQNAIRKREIKGVTNPADATKYVRKGHISYKQAVNISKQFTFEGLSYDVKNGSINAGIGAGISSVITFGLCMLNGEDTKEAMEKTVVSGLKTGAIVLLNHMAQGQLSRTRGYYVKLGVQNIRNMFSKDVAKYILSVTEEKMLLKEMSETSLKHAAARKVLSETVGGAITIAVLEVEDIIVLFSGRMSREQFAKNFLETCGTVLGAAAGAKLGSIVGELVVPGGAAVGGAAGGLLGGPAGYVAAKTGTEEILGLEDDTKKMYEIIRERFSILANEYLLNEADVKIAIDELNIRLNQDNFMLLYKSEDRKAFADSLLEPIMQRRLAAKPKIKPPTELELRKELRSLVGKEMLVH